MLSSLLQQVVNQRSTECPQVRRQNEDGDLLLRRFRLERSDSTVIDEISEVIEINSYENGDSSSSNSSGLSDSDYGIEAILPRSVMAQLRLYVTQIASMYDVNNLFHNFEHASHVTFAAYQLARRAVTREIATTPTDCSSKKCCDTDPWDNLPFDLTTSSSTNGLATDALAQFAVVFSALIHDVDHRGVPNVQLAKEKPDFASKYQSKSIAEQNSVEMAWELLEDDNFRDLRACIFPNEKEHNRFRSMVVNVVMATDICDPSLRTFREMKWERAFSSTNLLAASVEYDAAEERSRKATVVMDLIIQAADISHMMQPFDVYEKWNRRLYHEMHSAYVEGRAAKDPSSNWYMGELIFYDKHIIPLAKRLKESGAFGPAGDTLLKHAKRNRNEWESRGRDIFKNMQEEVLESLNVRKASTNPSRTALGLSFLCCCRSRPVYMRAKGSRRHEKCQDDYTEPESDDESGANVPLLRSRGTKS